MLILDEQNIKDHINKLNNFIPQDLLREALKRLSSSLEAFAFIRDRFIKNYSVICITGYILGIGDRHLENFLLNFSTGEGINSIYLINSFINRFRIFVWIGFKSFSPWTYAIPIDESFWRTNKTCRIKRYIQTLNDPYFDKFTKK